jgi:phosphoadenosine phosphosulfate reductase
MKAAIVLLLLVACTALSLRLRMGLDPGLARHFPRDFAAIPVGTKYGHGADELLNRYVEEKRGSFLEQELYATLGKAVSIKERPLFSTALIAGDAVILDALAKTDLLSRVPVVFIDTFTLFPETLQHLKEVEAHYGFACERYHAVDCADQEEFHSRYVRDLWMRDIEQYDQLCKVRLYVDCASLICIICAAAYYLAVVTQCTLVTQVEPMNRALREHDSDCWINSRRRDHGAERASLPVWEGKKVHLCFQYLMAFLT